MEVVNATGMTAGYTMGMEPSGRELLVVVVKGTFAIPGDGAVAPRHAMQLPLIAADTFTGDPGYSAPAQEVDYAPRKPRCDILLTGTAHAPHGEPAQRVPVGVRVGAWKKMFSVVGARHWSAGLSGVRASPPDAFVTQAISYDVAFGGVDERHEDPARHGAYMANPVGCGWHCSLQSSLLDGTPLPRTEAFEQPVEAPDGIYAPMAFGPVGRGWSSRLPHAGTYDQDWIDHTFPFLPADFDDAYYQAAPPDQQVDFLRGGEEVVLGNLTAEGQLRFSLPVIDVPVTFFRRKGGHDTVQGTLDTLVIDTDRMLLTMAWRATMPLKKSIFEVSNVLAGRMSSGWWRARALGKQWHPSLGELVRGQRRETEPQP